MLRIAWKGIVARKRRLVMTSLIIVVGVAFISGTAVLSDLLTRSVNDLVEEAYQGIDAMVRSTEAEEHPMGVIATRRATPADQLDLVREVRGVRAAEGIVQFSPQMLDKEGERLASFGLPVFALNWLEDEDLASGNVIRGRGPTGPDEAVLDFHTSEDLGFEIGDRLTLQFPTGAATPEIVGIGGLGSDGKDSTGSRVVILETSWLQELINQPGGYNYISVAGDGSMSQDELATTIAAVVPSGTEVITGQAFIEENQESVGRLLDIIEQLVSAFGYLAAFVAAFVIYNIFSILIAQRTRELALLRAVGASRSQIMGSVMLEAAVVGVLAAAIGLLAGFGLAVALKRVLGSILSLSEGLPRITLGAIVTSIVVGVLTTIVSALIPAIRATRVAPVAAMSEVGTETARIGWSRRIFGVLFVVGGVTLVLLGVRDAVDSPLAVIGAGSALLFVSLVVIGPLFAGPISRFIARPLPALRGVSGRLARDNASRNPKRTTATGVALTIGVGVVTVIAVIAASFTVSFRSSFETQLKGDLVIDSGGFGGGGFQPSLVDQVAAVDGVEVVTPLRFGPTRVLNSVAGLEAAARPAEEIAADPTGDSGVGASGPAGEEGFLIG
ncbi:MAG TPA: FtsX-like permease family protein, partial [Microthrixaceae bacterium]|nr:FtsX-like permease family protein [Microthrixaceae bacterium]